MSERDELKPAITLILGGARSGKSAWAEQLAAQGDRPVLYVATATAGDAEMAERIAAHRAARPASWRTVEATEQLARAVRDNTRPGDLVLIDCLTLWVTNVILARIGLADPDTVPAAAWLAIESELLAGVDEVLGIPALAELSLILVSNEVGMGIVPAYALGRRFRDILGRVNRAVAFRADSVILMVAGLPVDLRRIATPASESGPGSA